MLSRAPATLYRNRRWGTAGQEFRRDTIRGTRDPAAISRLADFFLAFCIPPVLRPLGLFGLLYRGGKLARYCQEDGNFLRWQRNTHECGTLNKTNVPGRNS